MFVISYFFQILINLIIIKANLLKIKNIKAINAIILYNRYYYLLQNIMYTGSINKFNNI